MEAKLSGVKSSAGNLPATEALERLRLEAITGDHEDEDSKDNGGVFDFSDAFILALTDNTSAPRPCSKGKTPETVESSFPVIAWSSQRGTDEGDKDDLQDLRAHILRRRQKLASSFASISSDTHNANKENAVLFRSTRFAFATHMHD